MKEKSMLWGLSIFVVAVMVLGLTNSAWATLYDRGGGLIYDDDFDITWLQDANYAQTSGDDADGLMTWDDAMIWTAGLVYQGYSDWRLPTALNQDGSGPCGPSFNCTDSELGHLYFTELGNTVGSLTNPGPFINLQPVYFWTSTATEFAPPQTAAWFFSFAVADSGLQSYSSKNSAHRAWAVRDGDVDVGCETAFDAGNEDNFDTSDGAELTSPSADLQVVLSQYFTGTSTRDFDVLLGDRVFGHTFTGLPTGIVAAALELHLQGRNFPGGYSPGNDTVNLELVGGTTPFAWGRQISQLPEAGGTWNIGQDAVFTLDLTALPNANGSFTDILPDINLDQALDVYIQDDTAVDYMILTVSTCPQCDFVIDADGITTPDDGIPGAVNVLDGVPLTDFTLATHYFLSEIRMFDNDSSGSWTEGDDLFAEPTGPHQGANVPRVILDKDGIQQVNSFLLVSGDFLGIRYYDANNNLGWDEGEDIVLDVNGNYIFDSTCLDPLGDLQDLIDLIDSFDPGDFSNPNHQNTLVNKVNAIINDLDLNDVDSICEAIDKLTDDLLPKTDGDTPPPDWVTDPAAQQQLEDAINDLIATLQALADNLGGCQ